MLAVMLTDVLICYELSISVNTFCIFYKPSVVVLQLQPSRKLITLQAIWVCNGPIIYYRPAFF